MPKDGRLGLDGVGGGVCILKIVIAKGGYNFHIFLGGGGVKFWYTIFFWTPLTPRLVPKTNKVFPEIIVWLYVDLHTTVTSQGFAAEMCFRILILGQ